MGRILETLSRRDTNGKGTSDLRDPEPSPVSAMPRAAIDEDWPPNGSDIPFIEVPDEHKSPQPPAPPPRTLPSAPVETTIASRFEARQEPCSPDESPRFEAACTALSQQLCAAAIRSLLLLPVGLERDLTTDVRSLALGLWKCGHRPLLVIEAAQDTNLASLGVGRAPACGWSEVLAGMPHEQVIQETNWQGVHRLGPGHTLARLTPAIMVQKARAVLKVLTRSYGLVVLLAPNWNTTRLPSLLIHAAQGTCLVLDQPAEAATSRQRAATQLLEQKVNVVGSMLLGK